jgi:hypothetical protein
MKEIKNIDRKSLARITALIYGLVGFFTALVAAISTIVSIIIKKDFQGSAALVILYNIGLGLFLGVLVALLTALIGWIMGYLTAMIYNWFAGKVGGVKIEMVETDEEIKK